MTLSVKLPEEAVEQLLKNTRRQPVEEPKLFMWRRNGSMELFRTREQAINSGLASLSSMKLVLHRKGGIYNVLGYPLDSRDCGEVVLYEALSLKLGQGEKRPMWVRPIHEFTDGRFQRIRIVPLALDLVEVYLDPITSRHLP